MDHVTSPDATAIFWFANANKRLFFLHSAFYLNGTSFIAQENIEKFAF
jgi:hypothetical protein